MDIEFALSRDDLITLAHYQMQHSSHVQRTAVKLRWGYAVGFLLLALGMFLLFPDSFLGIGFGLLAVLLAIFYPFIHRQRIKRHVEQTVDRKSRPESFAKRKVRVTAEGIEEVSDNATSKMKWSLVDWIDITPDNTFISIGNQNAVIIPRQSVTEGNYDQFITSLRAFSKNKIGVKYPILNEDKDKT